MVNDPSFRHTALVVSQQGTGRYSRTMDVFQSSPAFVACEGARHVIHTSCTPTINNITLEHQNKVYGSRKQGRDSPNTHVIIDTIQKINGIFYWKQFIKKIPNEITAMVTVNVIV